MFEELKTGLSQDESHALPLLVCIEVCAPYANQISDSRFAEAEIMKELNHPHIIRLHEAELGFS